MESFEIKYGSHEPQIDDYVLIYDAGLNGEVIARGFVVGMDARWEDIEPDDDDYDDYEGEDERKVISSITLSDGVPARETTYKAGSTTWYLHVEGSRDPLRAYYVNLYHYDLARGGPEEGGWYYETGHPVDCYRFSTYSEAKKWMHNEGQKVLDILNEGRRDVSSVLSDGRYRFMLETHRGARYPKRRPHYC